MINSTQQLKAEKRRQKFAELLREIFQINQPELDFGLYRIMHARKDDINRFIERDLPNITKEAFKGFVTQDKTQIEQELDKAVHQAKELGVDPDSLDKVKDLKTKLADNFDLAREEGEVYDALVTFFKRYYSEGDFLSRRVYKDGTYAIPYQGEEVVLHWANKDQYYIKSSETLRDYTFRLNPEASIEEDPLRVHFKLVDAEAGAKDNVKEDDGSKRVFVLDRERPFELIDCEQGEEGRVFQELLLRFHFRVATEQDWTPEVKTKATAAAQKKAPTQEHLRVIAVTTLLAQDSGIPDSWRKSLAQPYRKADGTVADYSLLQGQLNNYTKKNSFDYFIHKDLSGFLNRELDFYIKNELIDWADIASLKNDTGRLAPLLSKVEVIRILGEKIIAFIAQLENFQKKLWLKKKFVTETNYCITLDRLVAHNELLEQIFDNEAQLKDWENLYSLDLKHLDKDCKAMEWSDLLDLPKYRYLMVDTAHFDSSFKAQLISMFDDLDEQCDGLLVHSENFQALNLLQERYREQVKCIYIDPPYNTGSDGFAYKDQYQHSSWLSCIYDRTQLSKTLLSSHSCHWMSIDSREQAHLKKLLDASYVGEFVADVAVVNNWKGRQDKEHIATAHENLLLHAFDDFESNGFPLSEDKIADYKLKDKKGLRYTLRDLRRRGGADTREERPNMFFPIYWDEINKSASLIRQSSDDIEVLPKKSNGTDGRWRWSADTVEKRLDTLECFKTGDEKWNCSYRVYLESDGKVRTSKPKSIWIGSRYSTDGGGKTLRNILPDCGFSSPKSSLFLRDIIVHSSEDDDLIMDYFAGSGTTGHAIIDLAREDEQSRKYILVEMGDYFDSVLKPRMQKVAYSETWKSGVPVLDDENSFNGVSHAFKYIRLESYEDTLGNLALNRQKGQQSLLGYDDNSVFNEARQNYIMNYMLEVETRGSQSLLNIKQFLDPNQYELKIRSASGQETKVIHVDLLETFNYLLGLRVEHIAAAIHFDAELTQGEFGRWEAKVKRNTDGAWWFRTVFGTNANGQKVLVVWRNLPSVIADKENGLLWDNAVLDSVLIDNLAIRGTGSQDDDIDLLYINGDSNISTPRNRKGELMEQTRLQLIEEAFHRLMFAGTDGVQ